MVAPQVWTSASFNQCFEAYSLCIEGPPLERPISPACHQFSYWQDVGASWSMEMCAVPKNGQSLLGILCSLWSTLEQSLGRERGPIQRGYVELFEAGSVTSDNTTRQIPMAGASSPQSQPTHQTSWWQRSEFERRGRGQVQEGQPIRCGGRQASWISRPPPPTVRDSLDPANCSSGSASSSAHPSAVSVERTDESLDGCIEEGQLRSSTRNSSC